MHTENTRLNRKIWGRTGRWALFCALSLALWAAPASAQLAQGEKLWSEQPLSPENAPDSPLRADTFSLLAQRAAPSVVSIETEARAAGGDLGFFFPHLGGGMPMRQGAGSGVIIHREGYILSNNHVVAQASRIKVNLQDGRSFKAEVLGTDPATDIALLKIDVEGEAVSVAPFGDSEAVKIGEWVMAIGNPMGLSHTVTTGIVSAKGRRDVHPGRELRYADFIQTDASINPGNSGGPLFNLQGQIVGINTAINAAAQGIGFAIPINMIKTILPQLLSGGRVERSWLGVGIQKISPQMAQSFGLERPEGALVASVVNGAPADRAGIEAGDIIQRFDGHPVKSHDDLPWLASNAGVGRVVEVEVLREGARKTVRITLERMPGQEAAQRVSRRRGAQQGALRAESVGLEVQRAASEQRGGVASVQISGVDPGSRAARSGLRPGDRVRRCNGEAIEGPEQLVRLLEAAPAGGMIRLLLQRGDSQIFVVFEK